MSAFHGFGGLSDSRRAERQRKNNRGLIIATTSVCGLLLVAAVAAVAVMQFNANGSSRASVPATGEVHATSKAIEALCSSTDYKHACESSLTKAMNKTGTSNPDPKDLVKASISVISEEISKAFSHSKLFKSNVDPKVKGAIEDCKELFEHAKEELQSTIHIMDKHGLEEIPKKSPELKNWLSAVISYQQTCVDGFPEGELKSKMEEAVKTSKQLTSNGLAIITEAASILSILDIQGLSLRRRLLAEEASEPLAQTSSDGVPSWVEEGDRRVLIGKAASKLKPHVVVAKDGSGDFKTITGALEAMPEKHKGRYVIYVKEGIYDESPTVTKKMVNVTMYGDGSMKTIVTGSKNFVDGTRTFQTATFVAVGEGFMAIGMGFRNTAGAIKHQAVAVRVQSDRSVFLNCRMEGYQDTLYAQTHRQYYRSCVIAGTVDFIFGDAAAVFQNCVLVVRRPLDNQQNIVTAHGRIDSRETTGFVIQNCKFVADKKLAPAKLKLRSYLGRPWKEYSRTIIMESTIGDFMHPDGYLPWEGEFALKTLYYGEYNNKGPGAKLDKRVPWPGFKVIKKAEALQYTAAKFIQGAEWIRDTGAPVHLGEPVTGNVDIANKDKGLWTRKCLMLMLMISFRMGKKWRL